MTVRKFGLGIQVNKLNLRLDNAELDLLEKKFRNDFSVMGKYIKEQIKDLKECDSK